MHQKRIPAPMGPTPSEHQALGRAIREIRITSGLSQAKLAQRILSHRDHVSVLERGLGNPTFETIRRLLHGLNTTLGELTAAYNRHYRPPAEPSSPRLVV